MISNESFVKVGLTSVALTATLPISIALGTIPGAGLIFSKHPLPFPAVLAAPIIGSAYLTKRICEYQEMDAPSKKATYSGVGIGSAVMIAVSLRNVRLGYVSGCLVAGLATSI